jgi:uncharacterized membrane protein
VPTAQRYQRLDVLRLGAILWMTVFHFCFDLNHLGFISQDFYTNPTWTLQRTVIVGLFLFTAGVSQAVAVDQGQPWNRFWKRWMQVAVGALLVSAGSYVLFPNSWIYFGVLHGLTFMLIAARWLALRHLATHRLLALAGLAVGVSLMVQHLGNTGSWPALFNVKALNGLGLNWRKPITEDFVPLLPWLGAVVIGVAAGQWLLRNRSASWLQGAVPAWLKPGVVLSQWSLLYYLVHQPVLFGALWLVAWVRDYR